MNSLYSQTYRLFRLEFFNNLYSSIKENNANIFANDLLDAEVILLLENPSISDFANFVGISLPNATYRINKLTKVGFVEKFFSDEDHRETILRPGAKFLELYAKNGNYGDFILKKIDEVLNNKERKTVFKALEIINKALSDKNA